MNSSEPLKRLGSWGIMLSPWRSVWEQVYQPKGVGEWVREWVREGVAPTALALLLLIMIQSIQPCVARKKC